MLHNRDDYLFAEKVVRTATDQFLLGNGGGSITNDGKNFDQANGFVVGSGYVPTMVVKADSLQDFRRDLARFVTLYRGVIDSDPDRIVGWWEHEGEIYFDISEYVESLETALELGKARGELAIFDLESLKDVSLA